MHTGRVYYLGWALAPPPPPPRLTHTLSPTLSPSSQSVSVLDPAYLGGRYQTAATWSSAAGWPSAVRRFARCHCPPRFRGVQNMHAETHYIRIGSAPPRQRGGHHEVIIKLKLERLHATGQKDTMKIHSISLIMNYLIKSQT